MDVSEHIDNRGYIGRSVGWDVEIRPIPNHERILQAIINRIPSNMLVAELERRGWLLGEHQESDNIYEIDSQSVHNIMEDRDSWLE